MIPRYEGISLTRLNLVQQEAQPLGRLDLLTVSRGSSSSPLCLTIYPSIYIPVFCVLEDRGNRVI